MGNNIWMGHTVRRASYRAVLRTEISEEMIGQGFARCRSAMECMREGHSLLTASLYRYEKFLFLYTEGVDRAINPDEMLASLKPMLQVWPAALGESDVHRQWIYMQPYYYHAVPANVQEWMENRNPSLRRGRIALLDSDKWKEYMEYHLLLMREGLIEGDRFHYISIHENVLFSYFEEPKTMTNLLNQKETQSKVLEAWLQTDPESHFVRFAPGQGLGPEQNFVFLPYCAGI